MNTTCPQHNCSTELLQGFINLLRAIFHVLVFYIVFHCHGPLFADTILPLLKTFVLLS